MSTSKYESRAARRVRSILMASADPATRVLGECARRIHYGWGYQCGYRRFGWWSTTVAGDNAFLGERLFIAANGKSGAP